MADVGRRQGLILTLSTFIHIKLQYSHNSKTIFNCNQLTLVTHQQLLRSRTIIHTLIAIMSSAMNATANSSTSSSTATTTPTSSTSAAPTLSSNTVSSSSASSPPPQPSDHSCVVHSESLATGKPVVWAALEEGYCCICTEGDGSEDNPIVFCDSCNMSVHSECYGNPLGQ